MKVVSVSLWPEDGRWLCAVTCGARECWGALDVGDPEWVGVDAARARVESLLGATGLDWRVVPSGSLDPDHADSHEAVALVEQSCDVAALPLATVEDEDAARAADERLARSWHRPGGAAASGASGGRGALEKQTQTAEPARSSRMADVLARHKRKELDMGFEVFTPTKTGGVGAGQCSISSAGQMLLHADDLRRAGIDKHAALLLDRERKRLALRKPKENEPAADVKWKKGATGAYISIASAIRALGLEPAALKGRRPVETMNADELIVVGLASGEQDVPDADDDAAGSDEADDVFEDEDEDEADHEQQKVRAA